MESGDRYGVAGYGADGAVPPPPSHAPSVGPPPPGASLRAAAAALPNLTGLGLGYALLGRWGRAAVCWGATAVLLWVALPADPDGVPAGVLVGYLLVLMLAAVDGGRIARRTAVGGAWRPGLAVGLGVVLLAVPAGGAAVYGSARDEARERMLLERLEAGDERVATASRQPFGTAKGEYGKALDVYRALGDDHPGSRAAKLVPDRLKAYYDAVSAPYAKKLHCEAVAPLTYLRTLPDSVDKKLLGDLAAWPDTPLAESLYACGVSRLGEAGGGSGGDGGDELGELLRTFPESASARRVAPAIDERIKDQVAALKGAEPCTATEVLRGLGATASRLPADSVKTLRADADKGVVDGVYACGVDQFEDEKFGAARTTLTDFARTYKSDGRARQARNIAIAAEIADDRPAAGKRLPPSKRPGGARMELVISNDAPNTVEVLYTGPVTGTVTLKACAGCERYSASEGPRRACKASSRNYPKARLHLPAGEYHFLYKHGTGATARVDSYSSGTKVQPGYTYTSCTYVIERSPFDLDLPLLPDPVQPALSPWGAGSSR
ncbi:hypothetical protein [Streptomyces sp. NE06-03C]|uniref:hypothetical protein n=1 Tax=Streptomyces sp. NE06-03C TaxID=3028694 RepID=UPI0029B153E0|nr:hypothetical protein [Streptomyces sp. NE06-03C]MDX2918990.1 hypothetical protein [Streptomyces sp. NE06-03C]